MRAAPNADANNVGSSVEDASFAQQLEAILDSDLPATDKLVLLKIRLRCDRHTLAGAYPSYAAWAASVKDPSTVKRTADGLVDDGILTRRMREGLSPVYGFSRSHLQALVTDWVSKKRARQEQPLTPCKGFSTRRIAPPPHPVQGVRFHNPPHRVWGGSANPPHPTHQPSHRVYPDRGRSSSRCAPGARTDAAAMTTIFTKP